MSPADGGWRRAFNRDSMLVALAGALPLLVYLRTMAPTVYGLDSAELTTGSYVLGIVHAPGSPLFLLLGHLFTWLPFGDVGYRVNLVSACAAAAAVACVCAILLRLTRDALVAVSGAWVLAFTYYFWISALAAELYALHAFVVAALLLLALRWHDGQRPRQLCGFAFCFGLGLGNHLSLSVLAPGFAYLVLHDGTWRRGWLLAAATACGMLGASIYLYLPLRSLAGVPMNYARDYGVDVATWHGFWWMVRGGMFQSRFFAVPLWRLPTETGLYVYRLWSNFLGLGYLIGLIGLLEGAVSRPIRRTLVIMFLAHLAFVVTYDVLDKELMLVPTYLIWGLWVGLGAAPAARLLSSWTAERVTLPGGALILVLAIGNLAVNFGYADISDDWSARARGDAILETIASDALYVGTWADVPIVEYLQFVEGRRADVKTANVFFVHGDPLVALALEHAAAGKPVYSAFPGPFRSAGFDLEFISACGCYQLHAPDTSPNLRFSD